LPSGSARSILSFMSSTLEENAKKLSETLDRLSFSAPVTHVYNPLDYAWEAHRLYMEKYAAAPKRVLLMGMNPGPWGMAQTGVPFGEISLVRDWVGVEAEISKPANEHPKRPIEGFSCTRSEVSGQRLWGLFKERFGTAQNFFSEHYVHNFCPLVWMADTGRNITPDKLPVSEREPVEALCHAFLLEVIETLQPEFIIGVGAYAEKQLKAASKELSYCPTLGKVLHPSPASPAANRGWAEAATKQFIEQGVWE